jgi:hypothetical protein
MENPGFPSKVMLPLNDFRNTLYGEYFMTGVCSFFPAGLSSHFNASGSE